MRTKQQVSDNVLGLPSLKADSYKVRTLFLGHLGWHICKKICSEFNFMIFADDKNPQKNFMKKATIHEIYYTVLQLLKLHLEKSL